jgi:hypothetical protein
MNPDPTFNPFLYASVGDDVNGMSLSVLSAFARQDVDPWEQAASLSRLPAASAQTQLVAMLGALPSLASVADRNDIAGRLIPLLPKSPRPGSVIGGNLRRLKPGAASAGAIELRAVMIYLGLMILGLWFFSGAPATPPEKNVAADAVRPPAADVTSSAQREQP